MHLRLHIFKSVFQPLNYMTSALRPILRVIEYVAPSINARIAIRTISNPKVRKPRPFEQEIQHVARKERYPFRSFDIATYRWGDGPKQALMVHGWEGRAANFGAIIPVLVRKGYTVTSFDAPSHGDSSKGRTSFFDYIDLVEEYLSQTDYDLLVSHSFGSVALIGGLYQMKPIPAKDVLILTSPDRFVDRIQQGVDMLGLTSRTRDAMVNLYRLQTGQEPNDFNISDFVKEIEAQRVLFVHDKDDRVVPMVWSQAVQQNWKGAEMRQIEGTGHFRMLWSPALLEIVEDFVN